MMYTTRSDWPKAGPIDLGQHDLPHDSSDTEWWYLNCHLEGPQGRELSVFAAFFRIVRARDEQGVPEYAYSITWALTDVDAGTYLADSRVDRVAPQVALEQLDNGGGLRDPRLNRALREVFEAGQVPLPDRMIEGPVMVARDRLDLAFGDAKLSKQADGSYRLQLANHHDEACCDLRFEPKKAPVRQGIDGVVQMSASESMFYYCIPRCEVTGTVTIGSDRLNIRRGQGWYDHEFGGYLHTPEVDAGNAPDATAVGDVAWNWLAVQLEDGTELSAYEVVDRETREVISKRAHLMAGDGSSRSFEAFQLKPGASWCSTRTFQEYPVTWRVEIKEIELLLEVEACVHDQEFITVISAPAFWEGRCRVRGHRGTVALTGLAYVERSGYSTLTDLDTFFGSVGREVVKSVKAVYPLEPSYHEMRDLIASQACDRFMDGVDPRLLARSLIAPVREITDRGGKSWRSYAALACCDVVGGDSRKFVQWLAMPELIHVGSLVVDDIQDRSDLRRGGKASHLVYGEPIAMNAGNAAYFMSQHLLFSHTVSAEQKVRLYDLYFQAMRAGHAGQAIGHGGTADLMPQAVETGRIDALEARILACHRLKTAVPAASLAAMGATASGGSDAQIHAVGTFFEALGLAFQIVDDVLNLRGFSGNLKTRAEDISNGEVTLPVARALTRLDRADRYRLWDTLRSKTTDPAILSATVDMLEGCGAVESCADTAQNLVESSWATTEAHFQPSLSKVMLRAFGWYVLQRHY